MPGAVRSQTIETPDGAAMGGHLVLPESGTGPGVVVLMEIFGVGPYIRAACERLAGAGYVALAPDLYRRIEPGLELSHDEEGLNRAMETAQRLDTDGVVEDAVAALAALREVPEVRGPVGVLGFCLGGTLAFGVAAAADPDAAVCYYGSGIAERLALADAIECPTLFHFGGSDPFIAREDAERICELAAWQPGWECHIADDAGHAFDNHEAPMFHHPEAARRAWQTTRAFLARTLGS